MAESKLHFPREEAERLEPHLPPRLAPNPSPTLPDTATPAPAVAPSAATGGAEGGQGAGGGGGGTGSSSPLPLPFVTLTFATSLDSMLALGPGIRTALSGPRSKAMTHYLRSRHDAICVGVGTAIADDPGLNCRLAAVDATVSDSSASGDASLDARAGNAVGAFAGVGHMVEGGSNNHSMATPATATTTIPQQPRPIIIDPRLRWDFTAESKVLHLARVGNGLAPYIVTSVRDPPEHKRRILEALGGKYIILDTAALGSGSGSDGYGGGDSKCNQGESTDKDRDKGDKASSSSSSSGSGSSSSSNRRRLDHCQFDWRDVLSALRREGLRSIMVEGGGQVINSFLGENASLVDSIIVTIAPTWLGQGGVMVSPPRRGGDSQAVARLTDTMWMPLGEDIVLCGRMAR